MAEPQTSLARRDLVVLALGGALVVVLHLAPVRPTNFSGYDEWQVVSNVSRGILGVPYANRPLVHLWQWPAALAWPHRLEAYLALHTAYLASIAIAVLLIARRLAPARPVAALVAGVLAASWAPLDSMRLDTVLVSGYAGGTLATLVALLLALEAARRDRPLLLLPALALAVLTTRGIDASLPLLVLGLPVLLARRGVPRPELRVLLLWEAALLLPAALALQPLFGATPGYQQSALGLDLHPPRVASRLLELAGFHLGPLVSANPRETLVLPVLAPLLAWTALNALAWHRLPPRPAPRAELVRLLLVGLVLAVLGWLPFALSGSTVTPQRTQILSGPGVGLALAALCALLASVPPPRAGRAVLGLLGGAVLALATGRLVALQQQWDETTYWPRQSSQLRALLRAAPDLRPNTLVVLIGATESWPANFTFRLALDYLYEGRAPGLAWGSHPYLFPARFEPEGVRYEPWPVIRQAWRVEPTLHRYDEVVVAAVAAPGDTVRVLAEWPDTLPPLPPGTRYAPRERILAFPPRPPARLLATGAAGEPDHAAGPSAPRP